MTQYIDNAPWFYQTILYYDVNLAQQVWRFQLLFVNMKWKNLNKKINKCMKIRNFNAVTVWLIYLNRNDSVKKLM